MAISESIQPGAVAKNGRDVFFAIGIVIILAVLFDVGHDRGANIDRRARPASGFASKSHAERRTDPGISTDLDRTRIPQAAKRDLADFLVDQRLQNEAAVAVGATPGIIRNIREGERLLTLPCAQTLQGFS